MVAHRGAVTWFGPTNLIAVFENRRMFREAEEKQLAFMRQCLPKLGGLEVGMAESDDKQTWAMLVTGSSDDHLPYFVDIWAAFMSARGECNPKAPPLSFDEYVSTGRAEFTIQDRHEYREALLAISAFDSLREAG
jgi:hypothetical protein